jgi:hypothetical protein
LLDGALKPASVPVRQRVRPAREWIMSDLLATLESYGSLSEAEFARGLLESHGIAVFLADENITHLYARLPVFAVRLQVRECDLPEARQILNAALSQSADEDC